MVASDDAMSTEKSQHFASYDLTRKIAPHLDKHLIFPLLEYLRNADVFDKKDICQAEISLLLETNMLDCVSDRFTEIGESPPDSLDLATRREEVMAYLKQLHGKVVTILTILEDPDRLNELRQIKSLSTICEHFQLEPSVFDELFSYAKNRFECGDYEMGGTLLRHYQSIMAQDQEQMPTWRTLSCTWGLLACDLLNSQPEQCTESIVKIDEYLETARLGKRELLAQRTWLLHWALFCIFKDENGGGKVLDLFIAEKNLMIMAVSSPHLFRYVAAACVLHKRLKHVIKDIVRILHAERVSYSDPLTRFLCALYVDVDFDEAQQELKECAMVFRGDYFLGAFFELFEENARLLVFEAYCRIHQCINIAMIATKLNMEAAEAELWIVKLIQNAKLDARIDSEKSRVVMTKATNSVYQQVIDKTKDLSFRSNMLLSHLEKREQEKAESMAVAAR